MWGALIGLGAGALMGKMKADQERKNIEAMNRAAAEQTRYSWASGGPVGQIQGLPSSWGNMLQGGMTGAMIGSQFGGAAKPEQVAGTEAAKAAPAQRMFTSPQMSTMAAQPKAFTNFEDILNQGQPQQYATQNPFGSSTWGSLARR